MNEYILNSLMLAVPLILAAMGGILSERSGIMNIALEGKMLTAACIAAIVGTNTGSPLYGLIAAVIATIAVSMAHYAITQWMRIDHIISGMALNLVAFGATNFMPKVWVDPLALSKMPKFSTNLYMGLAVVCFVALAFAMARTKPGLHLIAVGEDPSKARQMGLNVGKVRLISMLLTGVCCALSGLLIVTNSVSFTDGMVSGRGFIALAAVIIGGWRPIPATLACLAFGAVTALQIQLQGTQLAGAELPSEMFAALPYLATLVAMAGLLGKTHTPAGMGKA